MFNTFRTLFFFGKNGITKHGRCKKAIKATQADNFQPGYEIVRDLADQLVAATDSRVVYHGLENIPENETVLFVGNHQSYFDIPIILKVMDAPTAFVAKDSLAKVPILRQWLEMIGCVYINRTDIRQSMQAILKAGDNIKKGLNMVIFPEGTRSRGDEPGEFKKGSLKPATIAKCKVVPVFIDGSHRIFESTKGPHVRPAEVHAYFGHAIDTASLSRPEQKALAENIPNIILNLKNIIK